MNGNYSIRKTYLKVLSTEEEVLTLLLGNLGIKTFLKDESQGFSQFNLFISYRKEEEKFLKIVPLEDNPKIEILSTVTLYIR